MRALRQKFDSSARRFLRDQRGSAITMFAVFLMAGVGFAAVAIDGGHLYSLKNKLQTTADAAVLVAVSELPDTDAARTAAIVMAGKNMATGEHGAVLANADVVTGNWDSSTRTFTPAGDPVNAVRVVTRRSQANGNAAGLFFARILGFNQVDVETTAIASSQSGGDACVIALDPSADDALRIAGTASVTLGCGARVNSTSATALRVNGSGCLTASSIAVAGNYQASSCPFDPVPDTGMTPMADPLAYLNPPTDYADDGCDYTALVEVTTDTILSPGVYCGGIYIYGSGNVEFEPGTYTIDGRGLEISGSGLVEGNGVTFYIAPTVTGIASHHHWAPDKAVHFAGSANIQLSAPTSGDYKDVLIWQDVAVSSDLDLVFNGGADMALDGVLYAPNNLIRFAGNSDPGGATSIVAGRVYFTGNANMGSNPETALFGPGGAGGISLVQ
jgi:Flp pilus assembly protein TadG